VQANKGVDHERKNNKIEWQCFADLGFLPEESALLSMRAELIAKLREAITGF